MKKIIQIIITLASIAIPSLALANTDVNFNILIIAASNDKNAESLVIDPQIQSLTQELNSGFPTFNTFHLIQNIEKNASENSPASITLPTDATLKLAILPPKSDEIKTIELSVNQKMTTTVHAPKNAPFYQAGMPYKNGILVIAITITD